MNAALKLTPEPSIKDQARRHSLGPLNKMADVLLEHTEELMKTLQQQVQHNARISARLARQESQLQELRERDIAFRGDMTELLERFIELNLCNYDIDDVEKQQAWALDAYDQIQAATNSLPPEHVCDDLGTGAGEDLSCSVCAKYMPHPF